MRRWLIALVLLGAAGSWHTPAMAQGENLGYRLTALEEQVRQLVGQIQELQHQLRQIEARGGGGMNGNESAFNAPQQRPQGLFPGNNSVPPSGQPLPGGNPPPSQDLGSTSSFQSYDLQSYGNAQGQGGTGPEQAPPQGQAQSGQGDGNEMVELDDEDAKPRERAPGPKVLGQVSADTVNGGMPGSSSGVGAIGGPAPGGDSDSVESAALDGNQVGGTGGSPEQVYEGAYDQYTNRQFGEAEAGFRLFLSRYRDHELAGNAQYWLGETYYVQGKYKDAARSFLAGFQTFPKSAARAQRAPQARHVAEQARSEGAGLRRLCRGAEEVSGRRRRAQSSSPGDETCRLLAGTVNPSPPLKAKAC